MGRIVEFDALRGLAALTIMLLHLRRIPESPWVYSAVDLFFVLSGYLVTSNALKYHPAENFLPVFLGRRVLRIWPPYYLALALCLVLNQFLWWDRPPDAWPFYLTFTQGVHDYFGSASPSFSGMFLHTWTLAIEEQYYLLWPLLVSLAGRKGVSWIAALSLFLPPIMREAGFSPYLLISRGDGLAWGAVLALWCGDPERVARSRRTYQTAFLAIILGGLLGPPIAGQFLDGVPTLGPFPRGANVGDSLFTTRVCLIDFGLAGLVLASAGHPAFALLRDRRLVYLGVVSYGLYLYHPLVYATFPGLYRKFIARGMGIRSRQLMDATTLATCFVVAEMSRRWVEAPLSKWKDRLAYRFVADRGHDRREDSYPRPHLLERIARRARSSAP